MSLLKRSVNSSSSLVNGGETVDRRGVQAFLQRLRAELSDCRIDLSHGGVDRIVVLEQASASQQHIAMQRGLGEGKIVEDPERRRILRGVGRDPANQEPGQQREQQTRCSRAGGSLIGAQSVCDDSPAGMMGLPRYVPVRVFRKATIAFVWSSVSTRSSWA